MANLIFDNAPGHICPECQSIYPIIDDIPALECECSGKATKTFPVKITVHLCSDTQTWGDQDK